MSLRLVLSPAVGSWRVQARAQHLEESLGQALGQDVAITVAKDYDDLELRTQDGSADLVWAPPAVCAKVARRVRAIFKCVRHGKSVYCAAIVARRDRVKSFAELQGKRAAWVDPMSAGGYLLPVAYLHARKLRAHTFFGAQSFHGNYPDALNAVARSRADLAAVPVYETDADSIAHAIERLAGGMPAEALAAVATTDTTPTDALVATAELSADQVQLVSTALMAKGPARELVPLLLALEVEGFEVAEPDEYATLQSVLDRRSRPPAV